MPSPQNVPKKGLNSPKWRFFQNFSKSAYYFLLKISKSLQLMVLHIICIVVTPRKCSFCAQAPKCAQKGLNGQNSPKMEVFWKFLKIHSLLFAENLQKVATSGPTPNLYSGYAPKTLVSPPRGLLGLKMPPNWAHPKVKFWKSIKFAEIWYLELFNGDYFENRTIFCWNYIFDQFRGLFGGPKVGTK